MASEEIQPDLTLLFDLPVEKGLSRALKREEIEQDSTEGRFEREALDFHRRVQHGYLALADADPDRFRTIAADRTLQQVHTEVLAVVVDYMKRQTR